jgi:hypothetical protein
MPIAKFWAHLAETSDRVETWREVYGDVSVPIESPVPVVANSPVGVKKFYKVDLARLRPEQLERAIAHIVEVFGYDAEEVRVSVLGDEGLPLLADDVTVSFDARLLS